MTMNEDNVTLIDDNSAEANNVVVLGVILTTIGFATYGGYIAGQKAASKFIDWKQNRDRKKNLNVVSNN